MEAIKFESIGGDWIDPDILLPAILPLELSGEAIRSRLLTSSDNAGEELALRPDLTLAVVNHHIGKGGKAPVSYRYFGKAFRQPVLPGEPVEFYQTGFESFGYDQIGERDALTLSSVCDAISNAGLTAITMSVGDISIFNGVVEALNLSPFWTHQLTRAFRSKHGLRSLLASGEVSQKRSVLSETLSELSPEKADALLDEVLAMSGGDVIGGRSRDDILKRLQSQAEARKEGPLDPQARRLLSEVMDLEGKPADVRDHLSTLAQSSGLKLESTLDRLTDLFSELDQRDLPFWKNAHFSVQFGRRFDYYDGLVFELAHKGLGPRRPVAAGGRYDGLFSRLTQGATDLTAIGGVVRPDRIEQARLKEGVTR